MSKGQKIFISTVAVILIALALLSIAFAYYMITIHGNTSQKSITGKIGENEIITLTYEDSNPTVTSTVLEPGYTLASKIFTVTNDGNGDIESFNLIFENITNTLSRKTDLVYTLTCKETDKNSSSNSTYCKGVEQAIFPTGDESTSLILSDSIKANKKRTYTLTIKYNEAHVNQSIDINKKFSAKINIAEGNGANQRLLTTGILSNATTPETNTSTKLVASPETVPAQQISSAGERELLATEDKYGTSYYYRGNIVDNYVTFGGMCWRIVRIQGDGSVKIILQDRNTSCSSSTPNGDRSYISATTYTYGYKSGNLADYKNCSSDKKTCIRTNLQNWFNGKFTSSLSTQAAPSNSKPNLTSTYTNKIKYEEWELGDWTTKYNENGSQWYYESFIRLDNSSNLLRYASLMPSNSATNQTVNDYVATLTADEYVLAGGKYLTTNTEFYLYNSSKFWWTLTASWHSSQDNAGGIDDKGYLSNFGVQGGDYSCARPAIVLMPTVVVKGKGTLSDPFVVQ